MKMQKKTLSAQLYMFFFLMIRRPPRSTLFPLHDALPLSLNRWRSSKRGATPTRRRPTAKPSDRKSTSLNSSHDQISYAVFCLKKKKRKEDGKKEKTKEEKNEEKRKKRKKG